MSGVWKVLLWLFDNPLVWKHGGTGLQLRARATHDDVRFERTGFRGSRIFVDHRSFRICDYDLFGCVGLNGMGNVK